MTLADPTPFVRFVVVNYNAGDLLARCLESILSVDWASHRREIWVIDNASTDGSIEVAEDLADSRDDITIVRNSTNRGFGANNQAFEDLAGIDHISLVNPDATIEPGFLRPLIDALAEDARLGGVCPKILLDQGSDEARQRIVQNAGCYVLADGNAGDIGYGQPDGPKFDQVRDVFAFCGAAAVLRTKMLEEVGGFDESHFLYYEDTELSWRAQQHGWRFRYIPAAVARHRHGASTGLNSPNATLLQLRNRLTTVARRGTRSMRARAVATHCGGALKSLVHRPSRDHASAELRLRALYQALVEAGPREWLGSHGSRSLERQMIATQGLETSSGPDGSGRHPVARLWH